MSIIPRRRLTLITLSAIAGAAVLAAISCSRNQTSGTPAPSDSVDIGYGAQPKANLTGAVTSLSEDDLAKMPQRIEALLRGKVPGLEVIQTGTGVRLRIRGMASISQEQEPLVILDGIQIQQGNILNALAGLTPDDIKQISVLKDLASTSIYGGRGAGGVILITTKAKSPPDGRSQ